MCEKKHPTQPNKKENRINEHNKFERERGRGREREYGNVRHFHTKSAIENTKERCREFQVGKKVCKIHNITDPNNDHLNIHNGVNLALSLSAFFLSGLESNSKMLGAQLRKII